MANLTAEQVQFIIDAYQSGQSIYAIAPQVGCAPQTVHKRLVKAGVVCRDRSGLTVTEKAIRQQAQQQIKETTTRKNILRQEKRNTRRQFIIAAYSSGQSAGSIARDLGISVPAVSFYLNTSGIERRSLSDARTTRQLNERAFGSIETEEQAYWLGFLTADGGISDTADLRLNLQLRDAAHLERLRDFLSLSTPVRHTPLCAYLDLRSRRMCQDLARHGIGPRKSKTVRWPSTLPPELNRHYVRGVFDGDGTYCSRNRAGLIQWRLIGPHAFLRDVQSRMLEPCGLKVTQLVKHHTTIDIAYLVYGGTPQVSKIFRWLYDGFTICLERKRSVFLDYVERFPPRS